MRRQPTHNPGGGLEERQRDFGPESVRGGAPAPHPGLRFPSGVAVDDAGNLVVADSWNDRVLVLSVDDGSTVRSWAVEETPMSVGLGPDGAVGRMRLAGSDAEIDAAVAAVKRAFAGIPGRSGGKR